MKRRQELRMLALALGLLSGAAAAAAQESPAEAARASLEQVPHPPLEAFEKEVRAQIGRTQELLQQAAAELAGDPGRLGEAFGELGQVYHAYELAEAAAACYRNARRLAPDDLRWSYYLGLLSQQEGDLAVAEESFRRVLAGSPQAVAARVRLGDVLAAQNRHGEAGALLRGVIEDAPEVAAAWARLGEISLAAGRWQEAVEQLERALELAPEADRLHYPLGQAYRGLGDLEKARHHLGRHGSVGIQPPDPLTRVLAELPRGERVHLLQGRLAFQAGRFGEAVDAFQDAVHAAPASARARVNLATALAHTGAAGRAVEQYEKALELEPENATAHFNLGVLQKQRGDLEAAARHLRAALDAEPEDAAALRELADLERSAGDSDQALRHFARARSLAPRDEEAWLGEASLLVDLGRYRDAVATLDEARQHLPGQGRLLHALARLLAGSPDPSIRDGERALDLALRVFEARRTISHAETVAMALAQLGRCEDAASWQRSALEEAQRSGEEQRLQTLSETLALYEQGGDCRYRTSGSGSLSDAAGDPAAP